MIKESPEYIEQYGRTNDIVMGIIMFWCLTSINKDRYNLTYFNEKMDRYLDHESTEEQMNRYKKEMIHSIMDDDNTINTIKKVIDIIVEIYGSTNLDYQLHMYGGSEDGSGDWWLSNREELMDSIDREGGIFSIIASSNGVSLTLGDRMNFLSADDWKDLYKYYNRKHNIDKILEA